MKKLIFLAIFWSFMLNVHWSLPAMAGFPDVSSDHPHVDGVEYGQQSGILDGYGDDLFRPDQSVNRAEFTKIVMNALFKAEIAGGNCFPDISDEWFAPFVCTAKLKSILGGYPDGTFKPVQTISFAEAAKIIVNAFQIEVSSDNEIWFKPFIDALGVKRAIPLSVNDFGHDMTRGELAEIIYRLLENVTDKASQTYQTVEIGTNTKEILACPDDVNDVFDASGTWKINTDSGWDIIRMTMNRDQMTGDYDYLDDMKKGTVEGTRYGNKIIGTWTQPNNYGGIVFEFCDNGAFFRPLWSEQDSLFYKDQEDKATRVIFE